MVVKALAFVALVMVSTASSAVQGGEPMYITHMYSDPGHTQEVGTISGQCRFRPGQGYYVQYTLVGTYTYEQVDELVGYCPDEPI